MLDERHISARCLMSSGLWALCVVAWAVSWMVEQPDLGRLSLILCGAAVTVTVKGMFIAQRRYIKSVAAVTSVVGSSVRTLH